MVIPDVEEEETQITVEPGYYNDLLMPLSILVAIQVALLISLAEQGKINSNGSIVLFLVITFTLSLLGWSFTGHSFEKKVLGSGRAKAVRRIRVGAGRSIMEFHYYLTEFALTSTIILIIIYLKEFT